MINKKRQELIIQNLNSISSEVRAKSIDQLMQLSQISNAEKQQYIKPLLKDSDEDVRQLASKMFNSLSGNESESPALGLPSINSLDNPSQFSSTGASPTNLVPPSPDSSPEPLSTLPPIVQTPTENALPVSPVTRDAVPLPASSLPPVPPSQPENQELIPDDLLPAPSFVDDPVDPSLPDLNKMNNVATLLDHIRMLTDQRPSGYLTQLLELARSVMEEVALTALQALLNVRNLHVPAQMLNLLANESYSSQRRFLMLKIVLDSRQSLDSSLIRKILLREKDVIVKSGLVKVFARCSKEKGVETLITCLEDEDPRVRANTVEVIEEQNISGCEQKIIQLLEDPENRVKVNAAKFLVKNGYQKAFLTLRTMLVSPEVWLRDSVIFALGEIGDQASLTLLKAALKDPNQGIRLSVLKALARINNNTARQVLKAACGDMDPVVAQVAMSLFEKIKDTPVREDISIPVKITDQVPAPQASNAMPGRPSAAEDETPHQDNSPALPSLDTVNEPVAPPVQPISPPVQPISPPVQPISPPVQPISPPVQPISPPVQPISPPVQPVSPPVQPISPPVQPISPPIPPAAPVPAGMPTFAKPRSAEIYARLCSDDVDKQRSGARDIAFVMGDDQTILLAKAAESNDESIRIGAVKLLSRKKTPEAKTLLEKLSSDPNQTVASMAEKALSLLK